MKPKKRKEKKNPKKGEERLIKIKTDINEMT